MLVDGITQLHTEGHVFEVASPTISTISKDNRYQTLLQEYTDITRPTIRKAATHQVVHHIVTQGPPIAEQAGRLPPDKLKAAKAEFDQAGHLSPIKKPVGQPASHGPEEIGPMVPVWRLPSPE